MAIEFRADIPSAIEFRGWIPSGDPVSIAAVPITRSSGGTAVDRTTKDATFSDYTGAQVTNEAQINVSEVDAEYSAADPAITQPTASGYCAYNGANGSTRIIAQTQKIGVAVDVAISQQTEPNSSAFKSYVPGSLARQANDGFDSMMAAPPSATNSLNLFQSSNPPYRSPWNPFCWAMQWGVKLWPICVYKDDYTEPSSHGGATAVHPRFAIIAEHYSQSYQPGRVLGWVLPGGDFVTRTVVEYGAIAADLAIVQLDQDLPGEIGFAFCLPDDWRDRICSLFYGDLSAPGATIDYGPVLPVLWRSKNNRAGCLEWWGNYYQSADAFPVWWAACASSELPAHANRWPYFVSASSGDSGNGICLVHPISKDLILLAAQTSGSGGSSVFDYRADVNAWMAARVPGAALTPADLSAFPSY